MSTITLTKYNAVGRAKRLLAKIERELETLPEVGEEQFNKAKRDAEIIGNKSHPDFKSAMEVLGRAQRLMTLRRLRSHLIELQAFFGASFLPIVFVKYEDFAALNVEL